MKKIPKIEALRKVQRVDTPPFLLTRIEAKIRAAEVERLPVAWQWAGALAFGLLIFLNLSAVKPGQTNQPETTTVQLVESLNLHPSNQLYHE